jgi:hypothetical protein
MKIKEKTDPQGYGRVVYERIREIPDSAEVLHGAEVVPDDTPVCDWRPEEK